MRSPVHLRLVGGSLVAFLAAGCAASGHGSARQAATSSPTTATSAPATGPSSVPVTVGATTSTTTPAAGLTSQFACGTETPAAYAASGPIRVEAVDGAYSAVLSGTLTATPGTQTLDGGRLTTSRAGQVVFSFALAPPTSAGPALVPWSLTSSPTGVDQPVCLAQFAGSSAPTALVGIFTGGAHCCVVVAGLPLGGPGAGTAVYWGPADTGAIVKSAGSSAVIATADASFDYVLASHAGSGMPILVLALQNGRFVDITQQHRDLLYADDRQMWNNYLQSQDTEGLGVLAAWVADECRIGTSQHAFATLDLLNSQGKLQNKFGTWPSGSQYISQLKTFLSQHGYC
ncbi:MAG TPA: hypothetical protein VFV02_04660 [Acidimicrobiales bacterium]|nr:hypothetical protein [Acidimicrobiales bacterium]